MTITILIKGNKVKRDEIDHILSLTRKKRQDIIDSLSGNQRIIGEPGMTCDEIVDRINKTDPKDNPTLPLRSRK